jgi:hypothetical protein
MVSLPETPVKHLSSGGVGKQNDPARPLAFCVAEIVWQEYLISWSQIAVQSPSI